MPQTRSQSKLLSTILYTKDTSIASDQAIAKSTESIDSSSTYQLEAISENSPANSVATVASVVSVNSPPNPTVLNLERYKRIQDRELPPTPKRVRFEPTSQVSPTDLKRAYKTPEESSITVLAVTQ